MPINYSYKPKEGEAIFGPEGIQRSQSNSSGSFHFSSEIDTDVLISSKWGIDHVWISGSFYYVSGSSVIKKEYDGTTKYSLNLSSPYSVCVRQGSVPIKNDREDLAISDEGCWIVDSSDKELLRTDSELNVEKEITNLNTPTILVGSPDGGCYLFDDGFDWIIKFNEYGEAESYIEYSSVGISGSSDVVSADTDGENSLWIADGEYVKKVKYNNGGLSFSFNLNPIQNLSLTTGYVSDISVEKSEDRNAAYITGCAINGVSWIAKTNLNGTILASNKNLSANYPKAVMASQWGVSDSVYVASDETRAAACESSSSSSSSSYGYDSSSSSSNTYEAVRYTDVAETITDDGDDFENWILVGSGTTASASGIVLTQDENLDSASLEVSGMESSTEYWARFVISSRSAGASGNVRINQFWFRGATIESASGGAYNLPSGASGVGTFYVKLATNETTSPHRIVLTHEDSPNGESFTIEEMSIFEAPERSSAKLAFMGDRFSGYNSTRADDTDTALLSSTFDTENVIAMGDMANTSNSHIDINTTLRNALRDKGGNMFSVPGNHDYDASREFEFDNFFDAAPQSGGYNWSGEFGEILFISIDDNVSSVDSLDNAGGISASLEDFKGSEVGDWVRSTIASSNANWVIVGMHHPAYSSSNANSGFSSNRWDFNEMGVDVVMQGHNHGMERLIVEDVTYLTVGLGGSSHKNWDTISPFTAWREEDTAINGSVKVYDSGSVLILEYYDTDLNLLDRTKIEKRIEREESSSSSSVDSSSSSSFDSSSSSSSSSSSMGDSSSSSSFDSSSSSSSSLAVSFVGSGFSEHPLLDGDYYLSDTDAYGNGIYINDNGAYLRYDCIWGECSWKLYPNGSPSETELEVTYLADTGIDGGYTEWESSPGYSLPAGTGTISEF